MEQILAAFRVISDRSFSCAGHVVETRGDSLITGLQECIYRLCYTRRFAGVYEAATSHHEADPALVRVLQDAHTSRSLHQQGWKLEQTHDTGKILAFRDAVSRWFLPGQFLAGKGPGVSVKEGDPVSIYTVRDSTTEQRSFYLAFGETISHAEEGVDTLRFYWNVTLAGAAPLMSLLTRELNRFHVPFLLKCGNSPEMFERRDAAVLYINRRYYAITARVLAAAYPRVAAGLHSDTPLFTRRLADGLAFAEDPQDGKSFGENRCTIVAEALRACYEHHLETAEQRLAELDRQFRDRGIDPQRPYLNPGSRDGYAFPPLP